MVRNKKVPPYRYQWRSTYIPCFRCYFKSSVIYDNMTFFLYKGPPSTLSGIWLSTYYNTFSENQTLFLQTPYFIRKFHTQHGWVRHLYYYYLIIRWTISSLILMLWRHRYENFFLKFHCFKINSRINLTVTSSVLTFYEDWNKMSLFFKRPSNRKGNM